MAATASRVRWEGVQHEDEIAQVSRHIMSKINGNCTPYKLNCVPTNKKDAEEMIGVKEESSCHTEALTIPKIIEPVGVPLKSVEDAEPKKDEDKSVDALGDVQKKGETEKLLEHDSSNDRPKYIQVVPNTLADEVSTFKLVSGENTPITPTSKHVAHEMTQKWKNRGDNSALMMLSALYGIVIFILGLAFPLSEVISSRIPESYYEGFYVYLYFVAIAYLMYNYILQKQPYLFTLDCGKWRRCFKKNASVEDMDHEFGALSDVHAANEIRATLEFVDATRQANHGSFYLRMGAVVFGIGGMIYSGLDFGQHFDNSDPSCKAPIIAVSPASRVIFTFLQMYFIFLNAKLQVAKLRSPKLAQFGLMHLLATNMCVWLNAIIEETNHEIHFFGHSGGHPADSHGTAHANGASHGTHHQETIGGNLNMTDLIVQHHRKRRGTDPSNECLGSNLMSSLVESVSPFLFPCAIEYSLICAATMYEIWVESGHGHHAVVHDDPLIVQQTASSSPSLSRRHSLRANRRSPHHYSVDCTKANKGLFFGIFVLVLTIIAMILFFVLINRVDYKSMAITEVHLAEIILYGMTFVSVIIGMIQIRELRFDASRVLNLDEILIIVAQCGNIAYSIFTILGSQFSDHPDKLLVMMTSLAALVQGITQTIFILDAYKRSLFTKTQQRRKPGREIVTFLLVTNFAMWALTTMEKSRADAHPLQSEFYGVWQWAIITNISTPLAIFYRYHSTVCLCEIWKRCYKVRDDLY